MKEQFELPLEPKLKPEELEQLQTELQKELPGTDVKITLLENNSVLEVQITGKGVTTITRTDLFTLHTRFDTENSYDVFAGDEHYTDNSPKPLDTDDIHANRTEKLNELISELNDPTLIEDE